MPCTHVGYCKYIYSFFHITFFQSFLCFVIFQLDKTIDFTFNEKHLVHSIVAIEAMVGQHLQVLQLLPERVGEVADLEDAGPGPI